MIRYDIQYILRVQLTIFAVCYTRFQIRSLHKYNNDSRTIENFNIGISDKQEYYAHTHAPVLDIVMHRNITHYTIAAIANRFVKTKGCENLI